MPSTLFLIYNPGKKYTYWTYPDLSKYDWEFVGSGSTGNSKLPNESQWTGPSKHKEKVKDILTKAHEKLQKKDIIDKFVLSSSVIKYMGSKQTRKTTRKTSRSSRKPSRKTSRSSRKLSRKTSRKPSRKTSRSSRKTSRKSTRCGTYKYKKAKNINKDKTKETSEKYTTRNSPPYHASAYCGKNKRGNDGKLYFSKKMNNGSCRWVKV